MLKKYTGSPDYTLKTVERACDVLASFREGEVLRLRDVATRASLDESTALRLLRTLAGRNLIERIPPHHYRSRFRLDSAKPRTIGYAAQSTEFAFSRDVTESIKIAAEARGIRLIAVDNRYSKTAALRNTSSLIERRVDLVMEFQTDEHVAPIISSKYQDAGIPVIAIEIPHPGAVYFGADNYRAGTMGGRYLGRWAQTNWNGEIDEVLLLELPKAGPIPASRFTGVLDGISDALLNAVRYRLTRLDGNGQFGKSQEAVRKYLRQNKSKRVLVAAINDPSALGAIRAFEEAGRATACAVLGQNASAEARAEMRRPGTRLVGSVAYFPERYGERLMQLAADILDGKNVPPAVFVDHVVITPRDVDRYYPNDRLITVQEIDSLMLQSQPWPTSR
jgi:ribose transport system substrate-binding protein